MKIFESMKLDRNLDEFLFFIRFYGRVVLNLLGFQTYSKNEKKEIKSNQSFYENKSINLELLV